MQQHDITAPWQKLYSVLLRLYPIRYRERFGEGMRQTFTDLLYERAQEGRGVIGYALWMCAETSVQIIRMNLTSFAMKNKRIIWIFSAIIGLLLIPFIAMQFTDEMNWSAGDFIIMGAMLTIAGALFEAGARLSNNTPYRVGLAVAVGTGFLLTWMNLAVGIIGSEDHPANAMYAAVVFIGFIGALLSAFKARGMATAALVTGIAQFLVPIIAFIVWSPGVAEGEGPGYVGVFILNLFFVALWLTSARLFKNAAEMQDATRIPSVSS